MAGRKSKLDDPDFAKLVAELEVRGVARAEMAEELNTTKDTLRVWVKDPRVQAHARTLASERVLRFCRKIDGEIDARLASLADWSLKDIMMVRKEYLDRPLNVMDGEGGDLGKVSNELSERMDQDPDFADQLMKIAQGARAAAKEA